MSLRNVVWLSTNYTALYPRNGLRGWKTDGNNSVSFPNESIDTCFCTSFEMHYQESDKCCSQSVQENLECIN
jgi:hypothetical protein